jgi:regulatory protein
MRQCARAERASGDALRLMHRWGVAPQEQQQVLKRLIDEKFIDDRRYAEAFVREKTNLSAWGEFKIRAALRNKGIASEIIDQALRQLADNDSGERLMERLRRKIRTIKYDTAYQLKNKLIRHGLSLGYPTDKVIGCVEKVMKDIKIEEECDDIFL